MYKKGDKVKLTFESYIWTNNYAGQIVEIVSDMGSNNYTVLAADGYTFMCPDTYFDEGTLKTSCNSSSSSVGCECGAWKVYGKDCPTFYHMFYCRFYKPSGD